MKMNDMMSQRAKYSESLYSKKVYSSKRKLMIFTQRYTEVNSQRNKVEQEKASSRCFNNCWDTHTYLWLAAKYWMPHSKAQMQLGAFLWEECFNCQWNADNKDKSSRWDQNIGLLIQVKPLRWEESQKQL